MAEPTSVALAAASIPSSADIARAEKFVRERFLHDGEDPAVALASGTPRRRALDQALAELADGAKHPSTAWRREFSLLLGLERVLSEDEPKLADGTVLSAHQVDALSGTLTALLAEALRSTPRMAAAVAATAALRPRPSCWPQPRSSVPTRTRPLRISPPWRLRPPPRRGRLGGRGRRRADDEPDDEDDEDEDDEDLGPVQRAAPDWRTTTRRRTTSSTMTRSIRSPRRSPSYSRTRTRSPATGSKTTTRRSRSPSSPRTPTPPSASGSSTRPAPARRSRRSASSRPRRPAGC